MAYTYLLLRHEMFLLDIELRITGIIAKFRFVTIKLYVRHICLFATLPFRHKTNSSKIELFKFIFNSINFDLSFSFV